MNTEELAVFQAELAGRLPLRARWQIAGISWDWDFSRAGQPLRPLSAADIRSGTVPVDWLQICVFGTQDIAEGGGASPFVGIHMQTGAVHGVDIERESPAIFFLNSSPSRFIETFFLFHQVLGEHTASPRGLSARVRSADPDGFDRSEWQDAIKEIESTTQCA